MRTASRIASKQSPGERGATIGTGASPFRPYIACSRSDCSVLVGSPVDGPPRWMSQMISGISSDTASPIDSPLSAMPGPDDDVTASAPPNDAPIAAPMPAISSSAWRSEEHTSELQSRRDLVCRLLLEKKKKQVYY